MQIYFPKSLNLTPSLFFKKGKSNHKEFNMKILYLYSTQKKKKKLFKTAKNSHLECILSTSTLPYGSKSDRKFVI